MAGELYYDVRIYPWALTAMQILLAYRRGISDSKWFEFRKARAELGKAIEYWKAQYEAGLR